MPLLKAEINLWPPLLIEEPADPESLGNRNWWAIYTLSRQEKMLMRSLLAQEIPFYCPLVAHQYRSPGGRRRTSYLPLFSNYVFMRGTDEQRYLAVTSGCISKCLQVLEPARFIQEMRAVSRLITADRPMTIESTWPAGTPVRVKTGPLEGYEGIIIQRRGDHRLLVEISMLHRAISVSIEDWDLEEK
ncbi:MAG: transcription termination/antitermination NusG family protein [Planctomycetaceae bacterium]